MAYPASYPTYVYSIFAFIGFVLCCIPFPWHLQAWNTGTCLYMAWTGIACLNFFINSIIWADNAINVAPVWCDISARILVGVSVAIPAASLCINRRLYHIACVQSVTITKAEKRRAIMVDLAIGLGIPILMMILQYIPQGHRSNIYEEIGCFPATYITPVGLVLTWVPPILVGFASLLYAVRSIIAFNKSRIQFKQMLSGHSNLNSSRYVRLMLLASLEVLAGTPLGIYNLVLNIQLGVSPWRGWADTHFNFNRVDSIPSILWRNNPILESSIERTRWSIVACALVFFAFFGFADEARKNYRSVMNSIAKRVGYTTMGSSSVTSSTGTKSRGFTLSSKGQLKPVHPICVHREMLQRHDSMDSFTDVSVSFADAGNTLSEKEKSFSPDVSYGALSLADVGGILADCKSVPYSPTPSSGATSMSSLTPDVPQPAVTRPDSQIEISSVRRASIGDAPDSIHVPEPVHTPYKHTDNIV